MTKSKRSPLPIIKYTAAGGVVVFKNKVLVLDRPSRQEIRLPKGHIEAGETFDGAALREVGEESGYTRLRIKANLGAQTVEFDYKGRHIIRSEYFFLMELDAKGARGLGEKEFEPKWLSWGGALKQLTFEVEREWVRRAKKALKT